MILSILIPTTPDRNEMFTKLYNKLSKQLVYMNTFHPSLGEIEILVDDSKRFLDGGLSIGKKREALVKRAKGKYLCFLDSDDFVSGVYLETLVRNCQHNMDVITFRSFAKLEQYFTLIDMSLHHNGNDEANPNRITRRKPWHICPVKREFAQCHYFDDSNYGEDWSWFDRVLSHCKTEFKTEAILHIYNHGTHSEADKITQHELLAKQ